MKNEIQICFNILSNIQAVHVTGEYKIVLENYELKLYHKDFLVETFDSFDDLIIWYKNSALFYKADYKNI